KPRVLFCAANFTRTSASAKAPAGRQPNKNGVIADCWREFTGSQSIDCARKFSRSQFRIFIDFFSRGSAPIANIAWKGPKDCSQFWNNSMATSDRWQGGNQRFCPRVLAIAIPNGSIGFVFPAASVGDV